jgi:hypothetical protein
VSGTGSGQFDRPLFLALDPSDNVFVVDTRNHRVQMFAAVPVPVRSASWGRIKGMYRSASQESP